MQGRKDRHHTVPRYYLSAWAHEDQVDSIPKDAGEVTPLSLTNASVVKLFYTPEEFLEGHRDPRLVEEHLARLEDATAPAVKRVPSAPWPLGPPQRSSVADFIAMMHARSPRIRAEIAETGSGLSGDVDPSGPISALREMGGALGSIVDPSAGYTHVTDMPQMFTVVRSIVDRAEWARVDFDEPLLMTGDSPVSYVSGFRRPSWFGDRLIEALVVPMSPTCALVIRIPGEGASHLSDLRVTGTAEDAGIINGWTLSSAHLWGYKHPFSEIVVSTLAGGQPSVNSFRATGEDFAEGFNRWAALTGNLAPGSLHQYYAGAVDSGLRAKAAGDYESARAAFARATKADDARIAVAAHFNLAVLEDDLGNLAEARAHYQRAYSSDASDVRAMAAHQLGVLESNEGNVGAARAWYQRAIDEGHSEVSPLAGFNLGKMEEQHERRTPRGFR